MNPYAWQEKELKEHGHEEKRAWFCAPRVGKTFCSILHIKQWNVDRIIIVSPLSVCPMWTKELEKEGYTVLQGYKGVTGKVAEKISALKSGIVIINDDRLHALLPFLINWKPQALIGDESHRYRGVTSSRGKSFRKLAHKTQYVRILTGTPTPNHYGNLWGQMSALSEKEWGKNFSVFAREHLILDTYFHNKVIGVKNLEELKNKINKRATIVSREEVFGPDTWQTIVRMIDLPKKARKIYDELYRDRISEWENKPVETEHLLTNIIRLQQITSGFINLDGNICDIHDEKLNAVLADLEEIVEAGEKAIIFHRFTHENSVYFFGAQWRFKDVPVVQIKGGQNSNQRECAINIMKNTKGPAIAVVQTQAGGTGIDFSSVQHAMFVSQLYNYDDEKQARDRIYNPGQSRTVTYYRAEKSIDNAIAQIVEKKHNLQEAVLSMGLREIAYAK